MASMIIMSSSAFGLGAIGVYDYTARPALAAAALFFLVLFSCSFAVGYAPLTDVVMTEVVSLRLRDMTQRVVGCSRVVSNFTVGFTLPYMIDTIGLQLGFLFSGICLVALVFTYLCVPGCKGKILEMIERLFHEGVPSRQFGSYKDDFATLARRHQGGPVARRRREGCERKRGGEFYWKLTIGIRKTTYDTMFLEAEYSTALLDRSAVCIANCI